MEALRLYVEGRNLTLSYDQKKARRDALQAQLDILKTNLEVLRKAFEPLRVSMDVSAPDVGFPIEDYIQKRGSKSVQASLAESLSHQEFQDLYKQATQNNSVLQQSISGLLTLIRTKYPDHNIESGARRSKLLRYGVNY